MKKRLALVALLALFLLPITNPSTCSIPAAIADELFEIPFLTAADGDESSDSITVFAETSADDSMQGMECDSVLEQYRHDAISYFDDGADAARWTGGGDGNPAVDSFTSDGATLYVDANVTDSDGPSHHAIESLYNDEMAGDDIELMGSHLYVQFKWLDNLSTSYSGYIRIRARNKEQGSYETTMNVSSYAENTWHTVEVGPVTWQASFGIGASYRQYGDILITFRLIEPDYSSIRYQLWLKYIVLATPDLSYEGNSDTYAESFSSVSDWSTWEGGGINTNGDEGYFDVAGDSVLDRYYSNEISFASGTQHYIEVRIRANITLLEAIVRVYALDDHGGNGTSPIILTNKVGTTGVTAKNLFSGAHAIESIAVLVKHTAPARVYVDYLRVGDETEMGWQHDGSTTAAVTDGGGGSSSSDGDYLSMVADSDGSTFEIAVDTTATAAHLSTTYYPMLGLSFHSGDSADYVKVESYDGAAWATVIANGTIGTDTLRANIKAVDSTIEKFRLSVSPSATVRMDWFKAFSIANFTFGGYSYDTNDVFYVESGVLKYEGNHECFLELDPALSVNTATYNVWNATISTSDSSYFRFDYNVGGWQYGTYGETRDEMISGTMTDMKFRVRTDTTISAIKFWEDNTAPTIFTFTNTPVDPSMASEVTIESIASDGVGIYTVKATAVVEPSGSNIGTVSMTLDYTTQGGAGIYSYTFSAGVLSEGHYTFELEVDDAANQAYEYLTFTVSADTDTTTDGITPTPIDEPITGWTIYVVIGVVVFAVCYILINRGRGNDETS